MSTIDPPWTFVSSSRIMGLWMIIAIITIFFFFITPQKLPHLNLISGKKIEVTDENKNFCENSRRTLMTLAGFIFEKENLSLITLISIPGYYSIFPL
jgi:hypothetical protein